VEFRAIAVSDVQRSADCFEVFLSDGVTESSRYLLIATGVSDVLPPIADIDRCYGRSVFHCPYCDAWEWSGRRLTVYGQGTGGVKLALSLRTWSDQVLLCTNGSRLDAKSRSRLERNGVATRTDAIAALDHADGLLTAIRFRSGPPALADALFFTTSQHPQCDLAVSLGCALNHRGTVKTGTLSETNIPRVFVAGDASRDAQFVVVAAAEGVKAAMAINQALQREDLLP
jgi:thioredoxin reductase